MRWAKRPGITNFVDQQISGPAEEALLEARILNVKPPYANFYRAALGAVDRASQALNGGRRFAQLNEAERCSSDALPRRFLRVGEIGHERIGERTAQNLFATKSAKTGNTRAH